MSNIKSQNSYHDYALIARVDIKEKLSMKLNMSLKSTKMILVTYKYSYQCLWSNKKIMFR